MFSYLAFSCEPFFESYKSKQMTKANLACTLSIPLQIYPSTATASDFSLPACQVHA